MALMKLVSNGKDPHGINNYTPKCVSTNCNKYAMKKNKGATGEYEKGIFK